MSDSSRREPAWASPFLEALARSGCVRQAVREAPVNRGSVYHRRRSNSEFALAWDDAVAAAEVGAPDACPPTAQLEFAGPAVANWRRRFLEALAETSNVTASAERANVPVRKIYKLKRENPQFAAGWLAALHEGYDQLEMELLGYLRDPRPLRKMDVSGAIRVLGAHREIIERRRALAGEDDQATVEALDAFFEGLRQRRLANEAILKLPHDVDDTE
jgi:hypothetical protein